MFSFFTPCILYFSTSPHPPKLISPPVQVFPLGIVQSGSFHPLVNKYEKDLLLAESLDVRNGFGYVPG